VSAAAPISPCTAVCILDPASGYCRGCFRTIDEISAWLLLGPEEKRRILAEVEARKRRNYGDSPPNLSCAD
jgi:predicted Fe-S protein YdhL (DUF1289 family)